MGITYCGQFVRQKFPDVSLETLAGAAFAATLNAPAGLDAAHSAIYDVAIKTVAYLS